MTTRIHIPIDEADKARYRLFAEREGKSLASWLRAAAEDRIRRASEAPSLRTRESLEGFFSQCDERERHPEPEWDEHLKVIERSRLGGLEAT